MSADSKFVPDPSWPTITELAIEVWGQPNKALSSRDDIRFGANGSKHVTPSTNTWKDFEGGNKGGGYVEMWQLARHGAPLPKRTNGDGGKVPPWENIGTIYPYRDADGALVLEVIRTITGTPRFVQRRPDASAKGGWRWNVKDIPPERRPLYRLPGLLASGDATVWITEGEKDADRLHDELLIATCNIGGAGKWRAEYAATFAGKLVVILPDNDATGRDHANTVAHSLSGISASVKVLALPGLPEKGDVSNWLDAGGTVEDLERLAREAQEYQQETPAPDPISHELPQIPWIDERLSDWANRDIPPRQWVVPEWIPRGQCTGLYGPGGVNKTDFLIQLLLAKSLGLPFIGHMLEAGPVYGMFLEDDRKEVVRRAIRIAKTAWGYDSLDAFPDFHFVSLVGFDEPEFVAFDGSKMEIKQALYLVDQMILRIGAHLVTLDTLPHFFGGDEVRRREVSRFIRKLDGISIARECGFLLSAHPSARGRQTGSMESGSTGWEGGFRARLALSDPGPEGGYDEPALKIASDRRLLVRIKSNYARQGEEIELVIRDGTFFVTAVGPEAAAKPPKSGPGRNDACDAKFLELLAAVTAQGSYVNESVHSGRYAPKEFAQLPGHGNFREPEFIRAMRRLFEAKRIRVIDFGPPSRGWRKIIDVQAEPDPEAAPEPAEDTAPEDPPPSPPTKEEIAATIADHIKLDDGERALQRVATAASLGKMPLKVFDGLVTAARKRASHGGPRPGSGRLPTADRTQEIVTGDDKSR